MELKINGKDYKLKFGLKFINLLDNLYSQEISSLKFGMGVEMMNVYLNMKHPQVLVNIIKAGTSHLGSKPSENEIEGYLEELAIEGKLNDLFESVQKEVKQAPFLKHKIEQIEKVQE